MKSLTDYIANLNHVYEYKVQIVKDIPEGSMEKLRANLEQFDLESCSDPVSTPIMEDPIGFPGVKNESITTFEVKLNYPANLEQIQEEARLAGIEPANIRITTTEWMDSMEEERARMEDTTRLETPEYPNPYKEQVQASTKYSESFKDIVKNSTKSEFEIAGGKTPAAKFNTDNEQGINSPMTKTWGSK